MKTALVYSGEKRKIRALRSERGRVIYEEDLNISHEDPDDEGITDMEDFLIFVAGADFPIRNQSLFRPVKGYKNLYEMKPGTVRLPCFMYEGAIIITSGFMKGS